MNAERASKASAAKHSIWAGLADIRVIALALVYCLLPIFFKLVAATLVWRWRNDLEVMS